VDSLREEEDRKLLASQFPRVTPGTHGTLSQAMLIGFRSGHDRSAHSGRRSPMGTRGEFRNLATVRANRCKALNEATSFDRSRMKKRDGITGGRQLLRQLGENASSCVRVYV
jgi:hypothetical protein